jgi:hypothetical protein
MRGSVLFSFKEHAQNGRGVKRATRKSGEFLHCLAARIRALCAFALLLGVCRSGAAQEVVSASSGVLQYFEGAVALDDKPVEHKPAVFPSLKNGSIIRTAKGRAELLLTPGVYLRMDENSSLRMESNSLMDTRLELTEGNAILDNLNATPGRAVALIFHESTVRFPKPGVYRIDCELAELEAYSGEAEVTHEDVSQKKVSSTVDSSRIYYFALGLTTSKFGDGATDEFYDWTHNRSDAIADQNQVASAEQDEAQDADPLASGGLFAAPPFSSPSYSNPSTSGFGYYSLYGSVIDPFYQSGPTPFLVFPPSVDIFVLAPFRHPPGGTKWPPRPARGYRPPSVITRWPTSTPSVSSYLPGTTLRFPAGSTYRPATVLNPRPIVTTVPRPTVAAHPVAPHMGPIGHHR